jgi:8-oxo-dGTP pyrophosphatase MutT (NUDIX family)
MLELDSKRALQDAVSPTDAATLLVVRDQRVGLEVFCVRRHAKSAFMGGAVVFPGGKLDPGDRPRLAHPEAPPSAIHPRALRFADDAEHAHGLAVCACRESLEEAALLPSLPPLRDAAVRALRDRLAAGGDFAQLLDEAQATLDLASLGPFARWVTPAAEQRRYDARFFMTPLPEGQRGEHDAHETTHSVWTTPARMVDAFMAGDVFLAPPTLRCLELLAGVADVASALALCAEQSLLPICPTFVAGDPPMLIIAGDPLHDVTEARVAGPTRFVLRDGKFVSQG